MVSNTQACRQAHALLRRMGSRSRLRSLKWPRRPGGQRPALHRQNVFRFMVQRLGISDVATAHGIWKQHFTTYNQSLLALRAGAGFRFDTREYWDCIRAGASDFLRPDPAVSTHVCSW